MVRTKPAGQRRAELLDTAAELVVLKGAEAFTIDDVTAGAGVAKGTFYLHFTNKTDLLGALRERYVRRFAETQLAAARETGGVAGVQRWMRTGITEYLREMPLHDVLFHSASVERDAPNAAVDGLVELLAGFDNPPADPAATALICYSAMHGLAGHIAHSPQDEQRMLAAADELCRALFGEP